VAAAITGIMIAFSVKDCSGLKINSTALLLTSILSQQQQYITLSQKKTATNF